MRGRVECEHLGMVVFKVLSRQKHRLLSMDKLVYLSVDLQMSIRPYTEQTQSDTQRGNHTFKFSLCASSLMMIKYFRFYSFLSESDFFIVSGFMFSYIFNKYFFMFQDFELLKDRVI